MDKCTIEVVQPAARAVCGVFASRCPGEELELTGKNVPNADVAVIDTAAFHLQNFCMLCGVFPCPWHRIVRVDAHIRIKLNHERIFIASSR